MEVKAKSMSDSGEWHWWLLVAAIAVLLTGAATITIRRNFHELPNKVPPIRRPPDGVTQKYREALHISTRFFDVQKCNQPS